MDRQASGLSPLSALRDCFELPNRVWWRLFLIVGLWKGAAVFVLGVSYEMDTATYLGQILPYHHPPLYAWFLHVTSAAYPSVHLIALVQTAIFALSAAMTLCHFFRGSTARYAMAVLIAVEPTSTFFCTNLMSECLFAALLMPWFVFLSEYLRREERAARYLMLVALGLTCAALYATRLAAIFLVPFFFLTLMASTRSLLRPVLHTLILLLVMEASLAPVKLLYLRNYESYSLGLFAGTNLWNSTCVLYPESSVRRNPQTDFERFMARRGIEEFTIENALDGVPIHGEISGYTAFLEQRPLTLLERKAFEKSLTGTATAMALENPLGYWTGFVWPNLLKPLRTNEEIPISAWVAELFRARFDYTSPGNVHYFRAWWWVYSGLLALLTVSGTVSRLRRPMVGVIVAFSWYYWLALGLLAAISLRYLLVLAPPLLIAAGLLAEGLARPVSRRPADGSDAAAR